ncbi:oligopeptide ABC transporter permease [Brevibacillus sp. NRS-1366]|uniref:oligopeptide ABC transporter permease n=1 Tax=Brevibacillus sp. NRS-1366 TaxID=3233899 RepID=UPI003D255C2C
MINKLKVTRDMFTSADVNQSLQEKIERESLTFWQDAIIRIRQNKAAVVSFFVIVITMLFAIIAPIVGSYSYDEQIEPLKTYMKLPPRIPVVEKLGIFDGFDKNGQDVYAQRGIKDKYFWFGTDDLARDLWARVWYGVRISLYIGFLAAVINILIGVTYGGISGYNGRQVDVIMMRIMEIIGGIPDLVVLILFLLFFKPGIVTMSIAMVLTCWMGMARVTRAQILKIKNQEYIYAARILGATPLQLIMRHMIPNTIPTIIIVIIFTIPNAIFYEAFLAFIGLGLPAPEASLGVLINDGYKFLRTYPYMMLIPTFVLTVLMLCLNIFSNGVRDAVDPKMRN